MVRTFAQMCDDVFRWESGLDVDQPGVIGKYSDAPGDRGGPTRWGITLATYARWRASRALPAPTADDVRTMPESDAAAIYEEDFFDHPGFNRLPPEIQEEVFDCGVCSGTKAAAEILQRALSRVGYTLVVDGSIGPETARAAATAVTAWGADRIVAAIVDERERYLDSIVADRPSQAKWARGWHNRAEKLRPKGTTDA